MIDDIESEIRLGESKGGRAALRSSGAASFPRDRHGLLLNQEVEVHLSEDYISALPNDIEEPAYESMMFGSSAVGLHKYLTEDSIDHYNRFIECYRTVTDSYWMRAVIPNEIVNFTIKKVKNGKVIDETGLGLSGGSLLMGTISVQQDKILRKQLAEGNSVTVPRQLDLDIKDKMELSEYTVAVFNSNQLFEFWTRREYNNILQSEGKTPQEARDRMWNSGKDQYHHIKNMYDMIESDLGIAVKSTSEWNLWYKHCRDVRNELVHEGRRADELDAAYAYHYTKKVMAEFKHRFMNALD